MLLLLVESQGVRVCLSLFLVLEDKVFFFFYINKSLIQLITILLFV